MNKKSNNVIFPSEEEMLNTAGIACWKNLDLQYVGGSKNMIKNFGFRDLNEVVGSTVYDIKCQMVKCADTFVAQDTQVIKENIIMNVLNIHPFADGDYKILIGSRSPIIDKITGIVNGTKYQGILLDNISFTSMLNIVLQSSQYFLGKNKKQSYSFSDKKTNIDLTKQEQECLFYLLHGFTAKHTAQQMGLSNRTVEFYLSKVKEKFNCNFKKDLVDKAISLGYLTYFPENILNKNISIIL